MSDALRPLRLVFLLCFSLLALAAAEAVRVRVVDPTGSPIPGAKITFLGLQAEIRSDSSGYATLPLGSRIRVAVDGFQPRELSVTLAPILEIQLQVEGQREVLTVAESPTYMQPLSSTGLKTLTPLLDTPQNIALLGRAQIQDQLMSSIADVVRYVPGVQAAQGEGNRDQLVIRGNNTTADFFVDGVRDDVQYYRDLYNLERVEILKGPNSMIFGRGGGGGVINRVTKAADFNPLREISVQGGSFGNRRASADWALAFRERLALRLNTLYENSNNFRRFGNLERYGINPAFTYRWTERTRLQGEYERFSDLRVTDRGVPSFAGRPAAVDLRLFYGNPDDARSRAGVHHASFVVDHQIGRLNLRNRTHLADYDKFYRNYVPGAVNPAQTQISLSAYDNQTDRRNLFNQTDLISTFTRHTLLTGAEFGFQNTGNFRQTGYFGPTATTLSRPLHEGAFFLPVDFRQSASDANNQVRVRVAAAYLQDQFRPARWLQLVGGLRVDRFDLRFLNRRTAQPLQRIDNLLSPRAGLVLKPVENVSLYASYSVSFLPSAGDQFASLTSLTQQVQPEKFVNREIGLKWDLRRSLSLTFALYQLNRTNTRSVDPNDPTRIVQTGSQRTNGFEAGWSGNLTRRWQVSGGIGWLDAYVTSATVSARQGAKVDQVPTATFSLWNNFQLFPRLSAGLGITNRSDMFAAIDNTVIVPGYTRTDAALFYSLTERMRLQANVENLFNQRYFANAHNNTNISPGSPFALRLAWTLRF